MSLLRQKQFTKKDILINLRNAMKSTSVRDSWDDSEVDIAFNAWLKVWYDLAMMPLFVDVLREYRKLVNTPFPISRHNLSMTHYK